MDGTDESRPVDDDAGLSVHAAVARHGDVDVVLCPSGQACDAEGRDAIDRRPGPRFPYGAPVLANDRGLGGEANGVHAQAVPPPRGNLGFDGTRWEPRSREFRALGDSTVALGDRDCQVVKAVPCFQ